MKKKGLVLLLGLTLIVSMSSCAADNTSKDFEDEKEALTTQIEQTEVDNLSKEAKNSVEKLQKEYAVKIEKAESKEAAEKLKAEYDSLVKDVTEKKESNSSKEESKGTNSSTNNGISKPSNNNQNNTSGKNENNAGGTSNPATNTGSNTGSDTKPNEKPSTGNTTTPPTSGNTNQGSTNNNSGTTTAPEKPKEKTVTVKVPIYGEQYYVYWIKDANKNIIYESVDKDEWEYLLCTPDNDIYYKASAYGQTPRSEIKGYREYVLTESEYYESNFPNRSDVTVTWN